MFCNVLHHLGAVTAEEIKISFFWCMLLFCGPKHVSLFRNYSSYKILLPMLKKKKIIKKILYTKIKTCVSASKLKPCLPANLTKCCPRLSIKWSQLIVLWATLQWPLLQRWEEYLKNVFQRRFMIYNIHPRLLCPAESPCFRLELKVIREHANYLMELFYIWF